MYGAVIMATASGSLMLSSMTLKGTVPMYPLTNGISLMSMNAVP